MMGAGTMGGGGLAETARLVTELDLKDNLTGGLHQAEAATASYGKSATAAGVAADKVTMKGGAMQRALGGIGGAAHHAGERVKGLATMLGAGGLLGGILGIVAYSKKAIDNAEAWADNTRKINQMTHMGVHDASQFSNAFDKLGVSADKQQRILGFLSRNLGTYTKDTKTAKKFQDEWGFSLLDSHGKAKSIQQTLLDFTDYFNRKGIPDTQKAALANKLFGRSWQDLLPIFEVGSKKVKKGMDEALTMTDAQMKSMTKWRDTQRELNDAMGDLSSSVGVALVPVFTEWAQELSTFIRDHSDDVLKFFKDLGNTARDVARFITGTVLPTVKGLADTVLGFWNSIPGPLKDLLVQGFVADRVIKFAFGFSTTDLLKGGLKSLLGGGGLFSRGSSMASPLYVKDVTGGLGGGGAAGMAGGAGKGLGMMGKAVLAVEVVAMAAAVWDAWQTNIVEPVHAAQKANADAAAGIVGEGRTKAMDDMTNMARLLREAQGAERVVIDTTSAGEIGQAMMNASKEILTGSKSQADIVAGIAKLQEAQQQATEHGWTAVADSIGQDIEALKKKVPGTGDLAGAMGKALTAEAKKQGDAADRIGTRLGKTLGHLQEAAQRPAQRAFAHGLKDVQKELMKAWTGDKDNAIHLGKAIALAEKLQERALAQGHKGLARNLGKDIDRMKTAMGIAQKEANRTLDQIAAQPTEVKVTTNVNTNISVRDQETTARSASRYGMVAV